VSLNLESVVKKVAEACGLREGGTLPWRPRLEAGQGEQIRPIHWANNPKSYMKRTRGSGNMSCGTWARAIREGDVVFSSHDAGASDQHVSVSVDCSFVYNMFLDACFITCVPLQTLEYAMLYF